MDEPRAVLATVANALRLEGITAMLVRGPDLPARPSADVPEARPGWWEGDIDVLVGDEDADAARRVFERSGWRYALATSGAWRLTRTATYLWDEGTGVDLHWGVPGAPFATRRLRRLERALWAAARPGGTGLLEPDLGAVLVFLAVQAARPGHAQRQWRRSLASCVAAVTDWDRVWAAAREAKVAGMVRRGLAGLTSAVRVPADVHEGPWERIRWAAALTLLRVPRPRRVRAFLTGSRRLARVLTRCRFGGLEVLAGPGVFVPRPVSEPLVEAVLEGLGDRREGAVLDVGTGCGAVALAVGSARPSLEIHAIDASRSALGWAERNRRRLGVGNVRFHRGSLLDPVPEALRGRVAAISSNVPYVPESMWGPGWQSRRDAVVGEDEDGLGLYRRLARQATGFLAPGGVFVMQMGAAQWDVFAEELAALGYRPEGVVARRSGDVVCRATYGK